LLLLQILVVIRYNIQPIMERAGRKSLNLMHLRGKKLPQMAMKLGQLFLTVAVEIGFI